MLLTVSVRYDASLALTRLIVGVPERATAAARAGLIWREGEKLMTLLARNVKSAVPATDARARDALVAVPAGVGLICWACGWVGEMCSVGYIAVAVALMGLGVVGVPARVSSSSRACFSFLWPIEAGVLAWTSGRSEVMLVSVTR